MFRDMMKAYNTYGMNREVAHYMEQIWNDNKMSGDIRANYVSDLKMLYLNFATKGFDGYVDAWKVLGFNVKVRFDMDSVIIYSH